MVQTSKLITYVLINSLGMMRWFIWLSQLFYLLLLLHFQFTSSFSLSSPFSSSSALLCSQEQSIALLQFKGLFSFSDSYPKMETWKEGTDCCSWDGVTCDRVRGDVIGLDLSCSWLKGTIPSNSSLFLLHHLQRLNLAFNNFESSNISSGFGQFSRLRYLNLSSSYFCGQVPIELSHLSQLASLDLSIPYRKRSAYDRTGENVPPVKLQTSVLESLLQNLTKLRELHLNRINMSSISLSSFKNLSSSLTSLALEACQLSGTLPDSIFRLPNLLELNLNGNNELMGFFPMVNWTNPLRFLDVSSMLFAGELPKSIGNLKFLRYLGLSSCNFSKSLPATLGNLTQLTFFDLSYNNFSGEIPSSLSNLKALDYFDLHSNNLSGAIPSSLSNLKDLTHIDLSYNNLEGSIPTSIGNVTKVTQFFIQSNKLIGQIPSSLSNLKDLTLIDLSYNNFEGSIPTSIGNVTKVTQIFIQSNNLIGQIPSSLSNLKDLFRIDLSYNNFEGRIPDFFTNLTKLTQVDLRANRLEGKFPVPSDSIVSFLISNNSLIGGIPSMICNASSLRVLDISRNRLGGTVPQCLGNSNYLSVMDLRMNNFHGTIPDTFVKGNWLTTLVFNGNQLEGQLPKSLVNCTKLEVLDLGNNKIIDFFPSWLEALPELKVLILKSNRFHGPIGNHKSSGEFFTKLRILDLSHNEFSGLLPRNYFQNLNAMMTSEGENLQYLGESNYYQDSVVVTIKGSEIDLQRILSIFTTIDLSCNKFEGEIPKVLGRLTILRLLNLSHNSLTGHIPLSLANLSSLESLDFSSNRLMGEIPKQLTSLTWLAMLNLSQNQLIGPIPQGNQFDTFQNDSYYGNLGLCGPPLSIKCSKDASLPSPSIFQEDNDSIFASGFGWKAVLMGYGCGFGFGLAVGYVFWFKTEKPQWLVRFFDGGNGKTGWPNNQRPRRRRS